MNKNKLPKFIKYLEARGVEILTATNEYELLRFKAGGQIGLIHQNKRKVITSLNQIAQDGYEAFINAKKWDLPKETQVLRPTTKRKKRKVEALIGRDGVKCFFCGIPTTEEDRTIEHIFSLCHGGRNHNANLALAHSDCNNKAKNMTVIEKVRFRERLRK